MTEPRTCDTPAPAQSKPAVILVIGGTGVFGTRLVRRLLAEVGDAVIVAGRSVQKAETLCAQIGGTALALDRNDASAVAEALARLRPAIVIDAAGPFQHYGDDPYRLARQTLEASAHYIDLADDRAFVLGITQLDALAKTMNRVALAGASSIPAISAAAADTLSDGLIDIAEVESAIIPGNRAPRGLSVIRAVLAQVGQTFDGWAGGQRVSIAGWSRPKRFTARVGDQAISRWACAFDAPDYALFPARYGARDVRFFAGLELHALQFGLWVGSHLVSAKWLRSLDSPLWIGIAKRVATMTESFGTDVGAMVVSVRGRDAENQPRRRTWTLLAAAGAGPDVPTLPAFSIAKQIASGWTPKPGAGACIGAVSLSDIETALAPLTIETALTDEADPSLFTRALGDEIQRLPDALRDLHEVQGTRLFHGDAHVERGTGLGALLYAWVGRFPKAGHYTVNVEMRRDDTAERWTRRFGKHVFHSVLSRSENEEPGVVWERFGPLRFQIALQATPAGLAFPVRRGALGPIPLPRWLLPVSDTLESVGDDGCPRFDVAVRLANGGLVVRYRGRLQPHPIPPTTDWPAPRRQENSHSPRTSDIEPPPQ